RFVHALTRDAVEASLTSAERAVLHRDAAKALEAHFAGDLSEHVTEIARHWAEVAPYGEAATARVWATRAADEAVRRLAYEEGVRLYRAALEIESGSMPVDERGGVLVALGRAASFSGDLTGAVAATVEAGAIARARGDARLLADAALVLDAVPDAGVNAVTQQLA